jgi:hypothetical protein
LAHPIFQKLWFTSAMAKTGSKKDNAKKLNGHHNGNGKAKAQGLQLESMLSAHRRHHGIFARVAQSLSVDPSYVSRVANGKRRSPEIEQALAQELRRIGPRA